MIKLAFEQQYNPTLLQHYFNMIHTVIFHVITISRFLSNKYTIFWKINILPARKFQLRVKHSKEDIVPNIVEGIPTINEPIVIFNSL